ncbi:MAG: AHH domain-containing protein [Croceibacterium sp.]
MENNALNSALRRARLPFRSVNQRDKPGFQAGMQRHHLLPCQLASQRCFGPLFEAVDRDRLGFDDFRQNGLLLPASGESAVQLQLPLHRGPHGSYNAMVAERVGQIECDWGRLRIRAPEVAAADALMRLELLQGALRRRLLAADRRRVRLNRSDPLGTGLDFAELDAMADALWAGTASSRE